MSRRSLLLIGSLALNLLLAAAFATHLWREHRPSDSDDATTPESLTARTTADSLADKRQAVRSSFAELRRAQARAAAALRREPFDRAELEAAFAALERARADHARRSHELLLELALRLDREGRHHLARRLEQERAIHPGRGRGSRGKGAADR
jgi:uncharacterized membrane protein